jgi:hypothetical protein
MYGPIRRLGSVHGYGVGRLIIVFTKRVAGLKPSFANGGDRLYQDDDELSPIDYADHRQQKKQKHMLHVLTQQLTETVQTSRC